MAANFGTLQAKVSRKLIDSNQTAVAASTVQEALNDALHYWKQKRFWFNEAQAYLTMDTSAALDGSTISDKYVLGYGNTNSNFPNAPVLPSNFLYEFEKDGFVILYSKLKYRFRKVPPATFDDTDVGGTGIPYIYCNRNGNYEFYFYPNLAYSLQVNYLEDQVDMVAPTDTNVFTVNADRLITYEALGHLMGEDRQDDKSGGGFFALADREYKLLKARSVRNIASGHISVDSILD